MLGIRTALKEDTHSTAAEMVYGTTIRLPGKFFTPSPNPSPADSSDYVSQLKTHMQQIRPAPPRSTHRSSHVSGALSTCTHVFIRHDAVRKPLQPPYYGPYPVVKRSDKHYTIDINGRRDTVSLDRLKPAHLDIAVNTLPQATPRNTVHWENNTHSAGYSPSHSLWTASSLAKASLFLRVVRHWEGSDVVDRLNFELSNLSPQSTWSSNFSHLCITQLVLFIFRH